MLRSYFEKGVVFATEHSTERCREQGILQCDIKHAVMNGEIIEQYPSDFPFPSCLILGETVNGRKIHVVMSEEQTASRIITAYVPDVEKWENDFKTRKENQK